MNATQTARTTYWRTSPSQPCPNCRKLQQEVARLKAVLADKQGRDTDRGEEWRAR